ncbi:TPA: hypothetical protein P6V18_001225 [Staphylococcus aureus]|nr:hypothetical protein [Staphylococcus aureus]HDP5872521.1 hypothetical protein [Staphylococcus aureus]HDP5912093.1 hypothetical protein [Staphylococcus aureus]HDP5938512.1 hypothetical protein [Staphylococcus aureus]
MKRKSLYLLCFLILPLCLVMGATAYAVANPVGQPTNAVSAKIEKYKVDNKADGDIDLDRYRALFHKEKDWNPFGEDEVAQTVNNVTNFFFEINKLIVSITDYGIENLYQLDVLDDFADKVGQFVGDIYEKLLSNIVMTLFIIICLNAFIIYSVKGDMNEALKRGFLIFCLIGFGVGVLANASYVIKGTNNVGKGLNNIIMNSTSSINGDVDYVNENSGINKIRNQYFDITLYKPYLIMNYGTVNEASIKKKDKKRIDDILDIKVKDKDTQGKRDDRVKDEVTKLHNNAMEQSHVFGQLSISIFTLIITIFVSIIFLAISFAKVIFSAFALILFLFLVFSWLLSFLPNLELSVFKALSRTLGYIILSTCMTFLFVIIGFSIDIANAVVKPESQQAYFLNVIFLMIILFVLYKKRSEIIAFVTRGNLTLSPQKLGAEAIRKTQDEFNKRRQAQAENKKDKRDNQRDNPDTNNLNQNNDDKPKRNLQYDAPTSMNNPKNMKRRNQQEEAPISSNVGVASYSSMPESQNTNDTKTKHVQQDDGLHRDVKHKTDIKRNPQTETSNYAHLSQPPKEVLRRSQSSSRDVQTSYDNNIEKRRVQNGQDRHYQASTRRDESTFKRNPQTTNSKDRLKNQKDINKHGK